MCCRRGGKVSGNAKKQSSDAGLSLIVCKGNYVELADATVPVCLAAVMQYLSHQIMFIIQQKATVVLTSTGQRTVTKVQSTFSRLQQ